MPPFPPQSRVTPSEGDAGAGKGDEASKLWREMQRREIQGKAPARALVWGACVLGVVVLAVGLWIVVFQ